MNSTCRNCGLALAIPVNRTYCPYHREERELHRRQAVSSAWHAKRRDPISDLEPQPKRLDLSLDAFQLAALHRRLIEMHRLGDAAQALNKLRELATRPTTPPETHRFGDREEPASILFPESS